MYAVPHCIFFEKIRGLTSPHLAFFWILHTKSKEPWNIYHWKKFASSFPHYSPRYISDSTAIWECALPPSVSPLGTQQALPLPSPCSGLPSRLIHFVSKKGVMHQPLPRLLWTHLSSYSAISHLRSRTPHTRTRQEYFQNSFVGRPLKCSIYSVDKEQSCLPFQLFYHCNSGKQCMPWRSLATAAAPQMEAWKFEWKAGLALGQLYLGASKAAFQGPGLLSADMKTPSLAGYLLFCNSQ